MSTHIKNIAFLLLLFIAFTADAQDKPHYNFKDLIHDSREELEALALYPDDIREAILDVCLYPEILVKIGAIQAKTRDSFHELIQYQPQQVQQNYWELMRYPGLVEKIVDGGQKTRSEIKKILEDYPSDIHEIALNYGVSRLQTLQKIATINREANATLELLLEDYQPATREKVKLLLKFPEVLHVMVEHIDLAVIVGDYYKNDPNYVRAKADSLQLAVSKKHMEDAEAWKKGLQEDPKALTEFEAASKEFKGENGYDEIYDPMYPNPAPKEEKETKKEVKTDVYIYYDYYPYPFWFGYPTWFPHVYWYRYPYWYHWGYYYGPQSSILLFGLPSYYYFYWYFQYPIHYYRYPHLSDYIIRYYRGRSGVGTARSSSLDLSIDEYRRVSRDHMLDDIINEDNNALRREKIREYGYFEESYRQRSESRTKEPISRDKYLRENSSRYPYLSGTTKTVKSRQSNQVKSRANQSIRIIQPSSRSIELNRAREQHQSTWERSSFNRSRPSSVRPSTPTTKKRGRKNYK
ncbi:hypothetical protein JMN32_09975 [Fulvivirga sp. 29W222]|uniref:DUF3300 domain-containing protein n=1 Tax=Fulvivirga marina TaxID=2494733 RepID=A0A937FV63_9BACT|nr:hypothetical protein [Fulvivirga marina]MBL6446639.1 hypothetical protein [Fulvivirga marina]